MNNELLRLAETLEKQAKILRSYDLADIYCATMGMYDNSRNSWGQVDLVVGSSVPLATAKKIIRKTSVGVDELGQRRLTLPDGRIMIAAEAETTRKLTGFDQRPIRTVIALMLPKGTEEIPKDWAEQIDKRISKVILAMSVPDPGEGDWSQNELQKIFIQTNSKVRGFPFTLGGSKINLSRIPGIQASSTYTKPHKVPMRNKLVALVVVALSIITLVALSKLVRWVARKSKPAALELGKAWKAIRAGKKKVAKQHAQTALSLLGPRDVAKLKILLEKLK